VTDEDGPGKADPREGLLNGRFGLRIALKRGVGEARQFGAEREFGRGPPVGEEDGRPGRRQENPKVVSPASPSAPHTAGSRRRQAQR
jgi:hypothetical protein